MPSSNDAASSKNSGRSSHSYFSDSDEWGRGRKFRKDTNKVVESWKDNHPQKWTSPPSDGGGDSPLPEAPATMTPETNVTILVWADILEEEFEDIVRTSHTYEFTYNHDSPLDGEFVRRVHHASGQHRMNRSLHVQSKDEIDVFDSTTKQVERMQAYEYQSILMEELLAAANEVKEKGFDGDPTAFSNFSIRERTVEELQEWWKQNEDQMGETYLSSLEPNQPRPVRVGYYFFPVSFPVPSDSENTKRILGREVSKDWTKVEG